MAEPSLYDYIKQSRLIQPDQAFRVDEASSTITYLGFAVPGTLDSAALWQIRKITVSGTITTQQLADGNANFDNIWDNRAALSYS